ncbi:hypothetical protein [Vibrio harveyi]|uniref:hypothetical protein n=1 Tax=Vibrio harveyi TaxID=669 RepID=UPI003CEB1933
MEYKLPRNKRLEWLSITEMHALISLHDADSLIQVKLDAEGEWLDIQMPKGLSVADAYSHLSEAYGLNSKYRLKPAKKVEMLLENGKTISKEVDESFDFSDEAINDLCEQVSSDEGSCVESVNL